MLLHGMTRAEVDDLEAKDFALGGPPTRPRHAATLILIDGRGSRARVLVGRRHRAHAFMPTKLVFPGGRSDASDRRVICSLELDPLAAMRIAGAGSRASVALARAIGMSAIREAFEEAGILLGRAGSFASALPAWQGFVAHSVVPGLDRLRLVGRAITPSGGLADLMRDSWRRTGLTSPWSFPAAAPPASSMNSPGCRSKRPRRQMFRPLHEPC